MKSEIKTKTTVIVEAHDDEKQMYDDVAPKGMGKLDMVIAFDTTGSMARYIQDVRDQVADMIPRLFKDNEDLELGIIAFGDYCDMTNATKFGDAYQCLPLTDNENDIIKFVRETKDTCGGDGDEFYELVLKKIIEEQPWREDADKAILLIADAAPHEIGYSYRNYVQGNQIDWREEAKKAASMKIKIDTVSIHGLPWYEELSAMTNGICVPFKSSNKTASMIETATIARNAMAFADASVGYGKAPKSVISKLRKRMDEMAGDDSDHEIHEVYVSYKSKLDEIDTDA